MNLYHNILKTFLNKDVYSKYNTYVDLSYIKKNFDQLHKLYQTVKVLQELTPQDYSLDDLEIAFYTKYPDSKKEIYLPVFNIIKDCTASPETVCQYLEFARKREASTELARVALEYSEGKSDDTALTAAFQKTTLSTSLEQVNNEYFVTDDLEELHNELRGTPGLRWRLDSLNKRLGSLRKGNMGIVFARPETGKTTFLASEISHMASQADGPIVWFNNEEKGEKVVVRCYQALLGLSLTELYANIPRNRDKYRDLSKGQIKIYDRGIISKDEVDKVCRECKPALIVFDQIDKVQGFEADRYDLKMKAIYAWARELAKIYGPVIGVCQAGGTADGKKYLSMNDMDSSHTAKQGECDWILGIGKTFEAGLEEIRYLHLSKNKLDGDDDTEQDERHGQWQVLIDAPRARYNDF